MGACGTVDGVACVITRGSGSEEKISFIAVTYPAAFVGVGGCSASVKFPLGGGIM
jgi:hypothetical protein